MGTDLRVQGRGATLGDIPFSESRVAPLWVYMTVMCREVEWVQIEKGAGWSVRQITAVWGRSASTVSREIRRNKWVALNENESYSPVPGCSVTYLAQ